MYTATQTLVLSGPPDDQSHDENDPFTSTNTEGGSEFQPVRSVAQYSPDYTGQRSWSRSGGLQLETSTTAQSCPTSPSPSVAPVIR
ncbi:hypothetical protein GBAR_LOCUS31232, partial [Geodia barretti]